MRRFSSTNTALKRAVQTKRPLELRPPVDARVHNVKTSDDHPLWQFFRNKQFLRTPAEVSELGNPWSIGQLRRKSFDDLHTLWYVCLKEYNALNRESAIIRHYQSRPGQETDSNTQPSRFDEAIDGIQVSMQHIRHVLAERYHGFRRGELELAEQRPQLVQEFATEFLEADSNSDAEVAGMMERFQYAFYGINPQLEDNIPTQQVIEGLFEMANLKLQRYAGEQTEIEAVNDVREAFVMFTCEHNPEGVAGAINTIKEVRASGVSVEDPVKVLAELISATHQRPHPDESLEPEAPTEPKN